MADPHPSWHWPRFEAGLCGFQTDRERLGLPGHFQPGRLDAAIEEAMRRLFPRGAGDWRDRIGAPDVPLADRIASGNLLALAGDPRIVGDAPDMIVVPGGKAEIGLPIDAIGDVVQRYAELGIVADWIAKECPRHPCTLSTFAIARFPVTNAEYRAFLLDTRFPEIPTSWPFRQYPVERANHPVHSVSAAAADAYTAWLSARTLRRFRLPTEVEWEWAAAGPDGREFPWGDNFDADLVNTAESGLFNTSSVGAYHGFSPFGCSDMGGNVEEYVADSYAPYPGGSAIADHLNAEGRLYRVARGGCFARFRDLARTRRRHGHNPKSPVYAMGFRLAESLGDPHVPSLAARTPRRERHRHLAGGGTPWRPRHLPHLGSCGLPQSA